MDLIDLNANEFNDFVTSLKQKLIEQTYGIIQEDITHLKHKMITSSYGNDKKHYTLELKFLDLLNQIITNTVAYHELLVDGVKNENMKELEKKSNAIRKCLKNINNGKYKYLNLSINMFIVDVDIIKNLNEINSFISKNKNNLDIYSNKKFNYIDDRNQVNNFVPSSYVTNYVKKISSLLENKNTFQNVMNGPILTQLNENIILLERYKNDLQNSEKNIIISKNLAILLNKFNNDKSVKFKEREIQTIDFIDILKSFKTKYNTNLATYLNEYFTAMNEDNNNIEEVLNNSFLYRMIANIDYDHISSNCRILQIFTELYKNLSEKHRKSYFYVFCV